MNLDDRYTIDTPENIAFTYAVAGIGSRFLAAMVDTLLLIFMMLLVVISMLLMVAALGDGAAADTMSGVIVAIGIVLIFLIQWGYYIIFEMLWNGQSPGKRLIRLRVVREGGRPVTFAASAIRNLVRFIDLLPSFYGLGVLVMFIDQRARRLGDLAAGTLVVKDRAAVSLEHLTAQAEELPLPHHAPDAPATPLIPNLHLVTRHDYDVVQQFLRRRSELGRDSRQRLGLQLAQRLQERLSLPDQGDHELFLEHLVREYRISHQKESSTG